MKRKDSKKSKKSKRKDSGSAKFKPKKEPIKNNAESSLKNLSTPPFFTNDSKTSLNSSNNSKTPSSGKTKPLSTSKTTMSEAPTSQPSSTFSVKNPTQNHPSPLNSAKKPNSWSPVFTNKSSPTVPMVTLRKKAKPSQP